MGERADLPRSRDAPDGTRLRRWVVTLGAISLAAWVTLARVPDLSRHIPIFLSLTGVTFTLYIVLLWRSRWGSHLDDTGVRLTVAFAVLFRVALVLAPASLSDDIHRYIWDGRVGLAGINPYRHAPSSEAVAFLKDGAQGPVNHPEVPTIYPPAAQLLFMAVARIKPSAAGVKAAMMLLDLALMVAIGRWLAALALPRGRLLVYAWSPLAIVEFAGMGHVDVFGLLLTTLGLWALARGRPGWSLLALGGAALAKLLPLVLVPFVLRAAPRRLAGIVPGVMIAGYLPYFLGGVDPTTGLRTFVTQWRGNEACFALLAAISGDEQAAKLLAGAAVVAVAAACWVKRVTISKAALWLFGTVLLVGPVVHAWYATWLLPFLCVHPSAGGVLLTGTISVSYVAWSNLYAMGAYRVGWIARAVEYVPPALAWLGELVCCGRRSRA